MVVGDFEDKWLLDNNTLFRHKKYSYYNQRNKAERMLESLIFFPFSKF